MKIFSDYKLSTGLIRNFSETDMCVESDTYYPIHSKLELLIPSRKGMLVLPARITRIQKEKSHHVRMGLAITESSEKYCELISEYKLD